MFQKKLFQEIEVVFFFFYFTKYKILYFLKIVV